MAIKYGTQAQPSVKLVSIASLLSFHTGDLHFKKLLVRSAEWALSKHFWRLGFGVNTICLIFSKLKCNVQVIVSDS